MILVTGGTGLVGAQLLFDLTKAGKRVRALKRSTSKFDVVNRIFRGNEILLDLIDWVDGDVIDLPSLTIAMKDVTEVFHCAALVSFYPGDYRQLMKTNVEGTANLINISLETGVKKFCYVSSTAALGRTEQNTVISEKTVWKESKYNSSYAISKHRAEREVWRGIAEGLTACIVNPSIILGPGDLRTGSTVLFGEVLKGLNFYPTGSSGFVDVRDVSRCMIGLMNNPELFKNSERFILNSENISYRDVINAIALRFGKSNPSICANKLLTDIGWRVEACRTFFTKSRPMFTKETARNGRFHWQYTNDKIKSALKQDFIPVHKSIEDTCRIFLEKG